MVVREPILSGLGPTSGRRLTSDPELYPPLGLEVAIGRAEGLCASQ